MLGFEAVKSQILFDLIPTYTKLLHYSQSLADVQICTRVALSEIEHHVFPREPTAADFKMQDAYEKDKDEHKGDVFDFVREVAESCSEFIKDQIETEAELEKESKNLAEDKVGLQSLQSRPGRVKLGGDAGYQNLID